MQNSLPKIDDMLSGAVCAQWVKCGRSSCRCARGELHGPYHYLFYREDGRLHKRYIKPGDVEATRKACARMRTFNRSNRIEHAEMMRQFRQAVKFLRGVGRALARGDLS